MTATTRGRVCATSTARRNVLTSWLVTRPPTSPPKPTDIAADVEGWLTAIGTALAGAAAAVALALGWVQFQRGGFTYSVRVIAGRQATSLLVTIVNKGRLAGHVSAVRVLQRPSALIRLKNFVLRRAYNPTIAARAVPQSVGALAETIKEPMALAKFSKDLKPGGTVTFRVEFQTPLPEQTFKATWLLVRFGDGRVVKKRPKIQPLSVSPPDQPSGDGGHK